MYRKIKKVALLGSLFCHIYFMSLPIWADSQSLYDEEMLAGANAKSYEDVHGFADVLFKNYYITARGLLVTDEGLTIQVSHVLILDLYKAQNACAPINKISVFGGIWNDVCTAQSNAFTGGWVELDWFFGVDFSFLNNWKFTTQFIQFTSPPHNFRPESNLEFTLYYDDSRFDWPIVINPYFRVWWAVAGDSTVVVGREGNTYYVEFGATPTLDLSKNCVMPVVFSAPTWISAGPASFWDGGELALKNKGSNWGLVSTGIKAKVPLKCIPNRLGDWYFDCGVQYFHLINDNLLQAQVFTLGLSSIRDAKRNIVVGYGGIGFEF